MILTHHNAVFAALPTARKWAVLVNNHFTGEGASHGLPTMQEVDAAFVKDAPAWLKVREAADENLILLNDVEGPLYHAWSIDLPQVKNYASIHRHIIEKVHEISIGVRIAQYGLPLSDARGQTGQALASGKHDGHKHANYWKTDPYGILEIDGRRHRRKQVMTELARGRDAFGRFHAINLLEDVDILAPQFYADPSIFNFADRDDGERFMFKAKYWAPLRLKEAMSRDKVVVPALCPYGWFEGNRIPLPADEMHGLCRSIHDAGLRAVSIWNDWDVRDLTPHMANLAIINDYFGEAG